MTFLAPAVDKAFTAGPLDVTPHEAADPLANLDGATGAALRAFADLITEQMSGAASLPLVQLADLLRTALPVRTVPAGTWQAGTIPIVGGANPVQIVGNHEARRSLTIINTSARIVPASTALVWVAPTDAIARAISGGGVPLTPGDWIGQASRGEVWAWSLVDGHLSFLAEQDDPA